MSAFIFQLYVRKYRMSRIPTIDGCKVLRKRVDIAGETSKICHFSMAMRCSEKRLIRQDGSSKSTTFLDGSDSVTFRAE